MLRPVLSIAYRLHHLIGFTKQILLIDDVVIGRIKVQLDVILVIVNIAIRVFACIVGAEGLPTTFECQRSRCYLAIVNGVVYRHYVSSLESLGLNRKYLIDDVPETQF